jgi:predicted molibdopterin-dependent oxidoreductase YjgC
MLKRINYLGGVMNITIDGRTCECKPGQTIYEVASENGIYIPVLCHHEQLKPVGACRVCVVEVENARTLVASCAMPVEDGMVVHTDTERIRTSRRLTVELLITQGHHQCITCESSGNCILQNLAYNLGIEMPRFEEPKDLKPPEQANEMIIRDMNKCVLCGLCVRACNEIQVNNAIDYSGRGPKATVGPPFGLPYEDSDCVFCGECVRICPVGALTEKPGRFQGRGDELTTIRTTCSYCGVGCQMDINVKDNHIIKVTTPRVAAPPPNFGSLCIKGRFGFDYVGHPERLTTPLVRKNGELKEVGWDEAITYIAQKLHALKEKDGPDAIAGLASARCTNEENYLFQKFFRAVIGTNNLDHCARL